MDGPQTNAESEWMIAERAAALERAARARIDALTGGRVNQREAHQWEGRRVFDRQGGQLGVIQRCAACGTTRWLLIESGKARPVFSDLDPIPVICQKTGAAATDLAGHAVLHPCIGCGKRTIKESKFCFDCVKRNMVTRGKLFRRQGRRCAACSATGTDDGWQFHLDHIMPLSRGGKHEESNLQVLCAACNLSKGTKTMAEWRLEEATPSRPGSSARNQGIDGGSTYE